MNSLILTAEEAWEMVMNNNKVVTTSPDNLPQFSKIFNKMCIWWPDDWAHDPIGNGDKESFLEEFGEEKFKLV